MLPMTKVTRNQPIYVFRLNPNIALRWTSLGILLFILATAGISAFYQAIHGQSWTTGVVAQPNRIWRAILVFLGFIGIPIGTFIVHELVHGFAFAAFGGSPRYGIGIKYLLPYAYATSPGKHFSRNAFIVILLTPLVIIDLACLVLLAIFPQATWLGWVVIINTSGAIGDIWMATLLWRCPPSITVEDRTEGMAIYAPVAVQTQDLPFRTTGSKTFTFWTWLNMSLMVFMLLIVISFLLPVVLEIFHVPSFVVGTDDLWILRWENNARGFGIVFNLLPLLLVPVIGLLGLLVKSVSNRHQ